ncbi:MAG: MFS transporter [Terriglobales bacterium]
MPDNPTTTTTPAARGLTGNVRVFGATSFFNDTASEMAYWILPGFLTSIGAGPAALGLIEGIAESVASFGKLGSGYLSDRLERRKPLVVAGYTVANAVKPVLAVATAWWQVLLIRFADRFSKGVRGAPRDVMLAESVQKGSIGSAFGLLQAMDSAGAIAGPLIALLILAHYGFRAVFWAAAVPGLISILIVALGARETRKTRAKITAQARRGLISEMSVLPAGFSRTFYYVLGAVTLFSIGNSSDMFLVLRAQNIGILPRHAPLLGLVFNFTYTVLSWPAGKLSDWVGHGFEGYRRRPRHVIVAVGFAVFAVVYAVFAGTPSQGLVWGMMALYGVYYALTNPVLRAIVADSTPAESRGRAFGVYYFVTSIATLAASILAGQLWKHFGPQVPFYLSSILALVAALLLVATAQQQAHH